MCCFPGQVLSTKRKRQRCWETTFQRFWQRKLADSRRPTREAQTAEGEIHLQGVWQKRALGRRRSMLRKEVCQHILAAIFHLVTTEIQPGCRISTERAISAVELSCEGR